jgi:uncharacterized membrane protein (UPF0127 family)
VNPTSGSAFVAINPGKGLPIHPFSLPLNMLTSTVYNLDKPLFPEIIVHHCDNFLDRFRGLMFHPPLELGEGLVFVGKNENRMDSAIHMLFMRMDITVVWLNSRLEVVDVKLARRWRPAYIPIKPAKYILELSSERLSDFQIGNRLQLEQILE